MDLQLQFLVLVIWVNWWTSILEVWIIAQWETLLLSFLLEETWEKIQQLKFLHELIYEKTDLNINIIVCFFRQLYEDCKER